MRDKRPRQTCAIRSVIPSQRLRFQPALLHRRDSFVRFRRDCASVCVPASVWRLSAWRCRGGRAEIRSSCRHRWRPTSGTREIQHVRCRPVKLSRQPVPAPTAPSISPVCSPVRMSVCSSGTALMPMVSRGLDGTVVAGPGRDIFIFLQIPPGAGPVAWRRKKRTSRRRPRTARQSP